MYDFRFYQACMGQTQLVWKLELHIVSKVAICKISFILNYQAKVEVGKISIHICNKRRNSKFITIHIYKGI